MAVQGYCDRSCEISDPIGGQRIPKRSPDLGTVRELQRGNTPHPEVAMLGIVGLAASVAERPLGEVVGVSAVFDSFLRQLLDEVRTIVVT
jgi:hypothetical protein